jgi:hypothetical protein
MKIYKANKSGPIRYFLAFFFFLPLLSLMSPEETVNQRILLFLLASTPFGLMLWIYLDTFYKIQGDNLMYHSAFLGGKITIGKIKEIKKDRTMWVGVRPALATRGLIIKYNTYDETYIAPEDNNELVDDLLKINPEIKVT